MFDKFSMFAIVFSVQSIKFISVSKIFIEVNEIIFNVTKNRLLTNIFVKKCLSQEILLGN